MIFTVSGKGGNGTVHGRREKFVPAGGPDGGDGGHGGSVFVLCDSQLTTLASIRYKRRFVAESGWDGMGGRKHGKAGEEIEVRVPVGTELWLDGREPKLLADMEAPGDRVMVAKGGRGGKGNARFASPTNRFPLLAEEGDPGEEIQLRLELKLLADVGIVGAPNAGKSSLLAAVTAARPRIADYPFTTLEPVLGVAEHRGASFVMEDIPGLIEGAHRGVGLGREFLRHIERTKVLVHLLDGTAHDVLERYRQIERELGLFNEELLKKRCIVVVNKVDVPGVREQCRRVSQALGPDAGDVYCVSAVARQGLTELMDGVLRALEDARGEQPAVPAGRELPVLRSRVWDEEVVRKVGDTYEVVLRGATRIAALVDPNDWAAKAQLYDRLRRMRVIAALEKAGIAEGDRFRVGRIEWGWE